MPSPITSPTTEATRPITRPSRRTERMTCLREAPSVRSVANSRVRWATVIDRVLKITKPPTSSAIAPKPSSTLRIIAIPSLTSFAASLACLSLSFTCRSGESSGLIACTSCAGVVPFFAATEITS